MVQAEDESVGAKFGTNNYESVAALPSVLSTKTGDGPQKIWGRATALVCCSVNCVKNRDKDVARQRETEDVYGENESETKTYLLLQDVQDNDQQWKYHVGFSHVV